MIRLGFFFTIVLLGFQEITGRKLLNLAPNPTTEISLETQTLVTESPASESELSSSKPSSFRTTAVDENELSSTTPKKTTKRGHPTGAKAVATKKIIGHLPTTSHVGSTTLRPVLIKSVSKKANGGKIKPTKKPAVTSKSSHAQENNGTSEEGSLKNQSVKPSKGIFKAGKIRAKSPKNLQNSKRSNSITTQSSSPTSNEISNSFTLTTDKNENSRKTTLKAKSLRLHKDTSATKHFNLIKTTKPNIHKSTTTTSPKWTTFNQSERSKGTTLKSTFSTISVSLAERRLRKQKTN